MDFGKKTNNKICPMSSLPMLVSLIETAIKEKAIDRMYDDFLEEALKIGLSSYTLNVLIVNAKKEIDNIGTDNGDDSIIPFVYRTDIIKPKPEIQYIYKTQEKIVIKNKKGYGFILSLVIVLLLDMGMAALSVQNKVGELISLHNKVGELISLHNKLDSIKSTVVKIDKIVNAPIHSFDSWISTNKGPNSKSNRDYSFIIKPGDKLSFDYYVSSESGYDMLKVYLYTSSDTVVLLNKSGEEHGTVIHTFGCNANAILRCEYSKDRTWDRGSDEAKVCNIKVYNSLDNQIKEIKQILMDDTDVVECINEK